MGPSDEGRNGSIVKKQDVDSCLFTRRPQDSGVPMGVLHQIQGEWVDWVLQSETCSERIYADLRSWLYGDLFTYSQAKHYKSPSIPCNEPWLAFDVKNAFLHGGLDEEIYMDVPIGYIEMSSKMVCKLQRTLYGLKQSPRAWFGRFSLAMRKYGFQQSNCDHTLFLKRWQGKVTTLIVYVDDMIITGNDTKEVAKLQKQLAAKFEMKSLGGLKYFLGIEVAQSKQGIFLSQWKYTLDLLSEVGLLDCKPIDVLIQQNHRLGEYLNQIPNDKGRYQRLVGKLIYLSHTRLNIAYAVSVVR